MPEPPTPRQTFAVLPAVDEQLLCVHTASSPLQLIRKLQSRIGSELVALKLNCRNSKSFLVPLYLQLFQRVFPLTHPADTLCSDAQIVTVCILWKVHTFLIGQIGVHGSFGEIQFFHRCRDGIFIRQSGFSKGLKYNKDIIRYIGFIHTGSD